MDQSTFKARLMANTVVAKALNLYRPGLTERPPRKRHSSNNNRGKHVARKYWPQTRRRRASAFTNLEQIVNSMSNWQRSQWAKDGYKSTRVIHFADLERNQ